MSLRQKFLYCTFYLLHTLILYVGTTGQRYRPNSLFLAQTKFSYFLFYISHAFTFCMYIFSSSSSPCSCCMQRDIVSLAKNSETVYANTVYNWRLKIWLELYIAGISHLNSNQLHWGGGRLVFQLPKLAS